MSVAAIAHWHHTLPDTPYNLWRRGELADHLRLPHDGTRVEIIGGEIVVSPGPAVGHNAIVQDVERGIFAAEAADSSFSWRCIHTTDLDLSEIKDGYIPDLIILAAKVLAEARDAEARHLLPHHIGMAVEVTSKGNAADDRQPTLRRASATKWNGYARVGVPYYLLVDRDPRHAQAILYSGPDQDSGTYDRIRAWEFGETIRLPEPFDCEISTRLWKPWS